MHKSLINDKLLSPNEIWKAMGRNNGLIPYSPVKVVHTSLINNISFKFI